MWRYIDIKWQYRLITPNPLRLLSNFSVFVPINLFGEAEMKENSHANNVLHFAIHAGDVERARLFYERVFGWRFEAWGPPDFYRILTGSSENPGIAGALQKRHVDLLNQGTTGFTCTVSVLDIEHTSELIKQHGGVISFSGEIPTVGRLISFEDTEGNIVSAMQYEADALHQIARGL